MIHSPRLTRKPIKIDENGYLNISELLAEMKLEGKDCLAYAPSGDRKITLAIKPSTGTQQGATKNICNVSNIAWPSVEEGLTTTREIITL